MTQTLSVLPEHEQPATALPKFQPGEKVTFMITIPVTAVIDGVEWDETAEGFYYAVQGSHVHARSLDPGLNPDIYVDEMSIFIDEDATIIAEDKLLKQIPLPSCEFDPN